MGLIIFPQGKYKFKGGQRAYASPLWALSYIHQDFEDPAAIEGDEEVMLAGFRSIRDEIKEWIEDWSLL